MLESDLNLKLVQEARGAIFYIKDDIVECVCYPFKKFFNYGEEHAAQIDWTSAEVYEKIDGSLMKMWYHKDKWHLSTNGTIDAFGIQSSMFESFGELFERIVHANIQDFGKYLNQSYCYMFELVSPETRVVIDYEPAVYMLGCRNMLTFEEDNSIIMNFKIPFVKGVRWYNLHSLEDCVQFVATMPKDKEGFVVCDKNFNRIKIKSPEYLVAHRLAHNGVISIRYILELIQNEKIDDFLGYCGQYNILVNNVKETLYYLADHLEKEWYKLPTLCLTDKKILATYTDTCYKNYERNYFFKCFDNLFYQRDVVPIDGMEYLMSIPTRKLAKIVEDKYV